MRCEYCDEKKGIETAYTKIYGDRDRVVYETERFYIFPCMGQLREGHLLIAAKKHLCAMGMLAHDALRELEDVLMLVGTLYKEVYHQNVLFFEHGVLSEDGGNGGCGIYHMHIHCIPAGGDEFPAVRESVKGDAANLVCPAQSLSDACRCVAQKETYVFFGQIDQNREKEMYVARSKDNYFVSQYMRKIVSGVFGTNAWDWRTVKEEEPVFLKTLAVSRAFFEERENRDNRRK